MKLPRKQRRQFVNALLDAFPTQARLRRMVSYGLDRHLDTIALGDDLEEITFKVVETAESENWVNQLLLAARELNPGNDQLIALSQQVGLASTNLPGAELERTIRETNSFLDLGTWRKRLAKIEYQVCRVEITVNNGSDMICGTGFLIGPDIVMTNYHVVEDVINATAKPQDVIFRFDYKQLEDGTKVNSGRLCRLANNNWLIDYSPTNPSDYQPEPKTSTPKANQLDYALLRLSEEIGYQPLGNDLDADTPNREWIIFPHQPYQFRPNSPLFIVQHPDAEPLKLALDTDGIIGLNSNQTRVTYRTNTEKGSSGSPCFNENWELVALHHAGDPNFSLAHKPKFNQGIPLTAILSLLEKRGTVSMLGENKL
ncbi:MAG: effector-associated domain EAD1-containing protein [Chloroflexota bacterium]